MGSLIINTCLFAESGTEVDAGGFLLKHLP